MPIGVELIDHVKVTELDGGGFLSSTVSTVLKSDNLPVFVLPG